MLLPTERLILYFTLVVQLLQCNILLDYKSARQMTRPFSTLDKNSLKWFKSSAWEIISWTMIQKHISLSIASQILLCAEVQWFKYFRTNYILKGRKDNKERDVEECVWRIKTTKHKHCNKERLYIFPADICASADSKRKRRLPVFRTERKDGRAHKKENLWGYLLSLWFTPIAMFSSFYFFPFDLEIFLVGKPCSSSSHAPKINIERKMVRKKKKNVNVERKEIRMKKWNERRV